MRGRLLVIYDELDAIEAHQSALGRQPYVTIPGLEDSVDGVLRKAAICLPGTAAILAKVSLRIEAERQAGRE